MKLNFKNNVWVALVVLAVVLFMVYANYPDLSMMDYILLALGVLNVVVTAVNKKNGR